MKRSSGVNFRFRKHVYGWNLKALNVFGILLLLLMLSLPASSREYGAPYGLISQVQTECEAEALSIGTLLADRYNSLDEETEWDMRIHNDYLVQYLGFAGWIQMGTWKSNGMTANRQHGPTLHKRGGWAGHKNISHSSYWALENQWLYMMGDSTVRQIWATFVSPFQNNDFERNAKEWTRSNSDNCQRQFPHRKEHPSGGNFPEEGWNGKCGNNEVTCSLSGFGPEGKITFDWKHFPWEDYDEWLFGPSGRWSNVTSERRPDILTFEVGLHTCFHAHLGDGKPLNQTLIERHEKDLPRLMAGIREAIERPNDRGTKTQVILVTGGRIGNPDHALDQCSWRFNRIAAREAHAQGFTVFEREELERRLLFKSEHYVAHRTMKPQLHLENPAPQIVATALLGLISCLRKNETVDYDALHTRSVISSSFRSKVLEMELLSGNKVQGRRKRRH